MSTACAIRPRYQAGSPPPPSGNAIGSGALGCRPADGQVSDAENLSGEQTATAEDELLMAERHAALREAFMDLPANCQQLLTLLITDPPTPYAEISARLGIPIGSIGPNRSRCLDRLRRHPAIAALIDAEAPSTVEL